MKDYLILFREPDGRMDAHSNTENQLHQQKVKSWMDALIKNGNLSGGRALSLNGKVIDTQRQIQNDIYKVGTEIVGGYLLIKSTDLNQATELIRSCPILERGGFAEIREVI
ncbi:MAG: hypothetical protein JST48_14885 [Bacteroidetes bacterium]|nr:hypothetical protein [Bacteroidota bacterium]